MCKGAIDGRHIPGELAPVSESRSVHTSRGLAHPEFPEVLSSGRDGAVIDLPLERLRLGRPLRLEGVNAGHVRALAGLGGRWPPIVVSCSNWVIVDGVHRYHAARSLNLSFISCMISDVSDADRFVESVRRNLEQGLPLTLRDRKHAARVILGLHEEWSDRRVAELCGIHHGTVADLRPSTCPTGEDLQLDKRRGRDGRERPVDRRATRDRVLRALESEPNASLRRIAGMSGASPETVRVLRKGLRNGVAQPSIIDGARSSVSGRRGTAASDIERWDSDSAFHSTSEGRHFVAWFLRTGIRDDWMERLDAVPLSRIYEIADEARLRSKEWLDFASALQDRIGRG
jgi:ParB-like chromosome segregation protein Spo0J